MANAIKSDFLASLESRFGKLDKLEDSQSLFQLHGHDVRLYIRYSKIHSGRRTFFGLRQTDLQHLQGFESFIVFLWDRQAEPLFLPFAEYQEVFQEATPAADGQYKVQVLGVGAEIPELYVAQLGRFNVSAHFGWGQLSTALARKRGESLPTLSHGQIQTLLGAIGVANGHDVWIPANDRSRLDWALTKTYEPRAVAPAGFGDVDHIVAEIDVLWLGRGTNKLSAAFEVEHSTTIYSGLLRFNDLHLVLERSHPTFSIVADDVRRARFVRQLQRPTFQISGLSDHCTFLDYGNVYSWHARVVKP